MIDIAQHIEFLLGKHDCVVVPGFGAFLCHYTAAHFSDDERTMAPPARYLAFNSLISAQDGLLAASVARKEQISLTEAEKLLENATEKLQAKLNDNEWLRFGRLGEFSKNDDGDIRFMASALPGINGFLPGLKMLTLNAEKSHAAEITAEQVASHAIEKGEMIASSSRLGQWRAYATGIVASLAVIVTIVMFALYPIRLSRNTQTASLVPTVTENAADIPAEHSDFTTDTDFTAIEQNEIAFGLNRTIALPAPAEPGAPIAAGKSVASSRQHAEAGTDGVNLAGKYCVVIASFPSRTQAMSFIGSRTTALGVLEKDGKFRVYSASASSRNEAEKLKKASGQADAWICSR